MAFATLIVLSPSIHFISYLEPHDCQRLLQLLLLCLILLEATWSSFSKENRPQITIDNSIRIGFYIIAGLAVASSTHSIEPRQATIEVTIFIALCYLALFVARLSTELVGFVHYLTYALLTSISIYLVSFFTGYITAMIMGKQLVWPYPFFGFSNIRLFQQYQLWGLGLIFLPLLAFDLTNKQRSALHLVLVLWWVLLFYAASRGVTLGWILAIVVTAIAYKKQAWPFLRIQLFTATTGLALFMVLFHLLPSILTSSTDPIVFRSVFRDTTYDRLDLWKVAYVMIKNFTLLGIGPMHFYFYNSFGTHPHNSILQITAEWGLPATIIILGIIVYAFRCWFKQFGSVGLKNKDHVNQQLAIILFFTVVANGAYSLVEGVIVMPISQVLMFTIIGLMIGQYIGGDWDVTKHEPTKKFHFRPILAVITLVFLVWSVTPELVRGLTSNQRVLQPGERAFSVAPDNINPRIWMQQRRIEKDSGND